MKSNFFTSMLGGICFAAMLAAPHSANAILIINQSSTPQWTTNNNGNLSMAEVAALVGYGGTLSEVYKSEVDGGNEFGSFANNYTTAYSPPDDPEDATITWDGNPEPSITGSPLYLLVKDGSQVPAQYVFDITGWNGQEIISLEGFWADGQGGISHISIYAGNDPSESVPDGGATIALLGLALVGADMLRRKLVEA